MRLIDIKTFTQFWTKHADSQEALTKWHQIAEKANWRSIREVRNVYPHADAVKVKSGRTVTVFNIMGGNYRLITAIHYNSQIIFLMMVLTHKEYSTDNWKKKL